LHEPNNDVISTRRRRGGFLGRGQPAACSAAKGGQGPERLP
jgi:hypothetical protein